MHELRDTLERAEKIIARLYQGLSNIEAIARTAGVSDAQKLSYICAEIERTRTAMTEL